MYLSFHTTKNHNRFSFIKHIISNQKSHTKTKNEQKLHITDVFPLPCIEAIYWLKKELGNTLTHYYLIDIYI